MESASILLTLIAAMVYVLGLGMNLIRKNTSLISLYVVQSIAAACALTIFAHSESAGGLLFAAILTVVVKCIMAPVFFLRLVRRYGARFSATSYLNIPLTLFMLAGIALFSHSFISAGIAKLSMPGVDLLIASIFSALFLMINRRGALASVVGILSFENGAVLLSTYLGVHHSFALEVAITFDIVVWIAIASTFLAMMYRQFGSIEPALSLSHLREE